LFTPAVAVVVGYVLLVGNPWMNRDLAIAASDYDSSLRVVYVLFSFPSWHVDIDLVGPYLFWFTNLRVVLFVALAVAGLGKVSSWVRETARGPALFVTTVGLMTLSAVMAGAGAVGVAVALTDERDYFGPDRPEDLFLNVFGTSASFGVLFGLVVGVVAVQSRAPATRERRVTAPKSFW
jgi:hypothetical protein